jgi:hypothetical protein
LSLLTLLRFEGTSQKGAITSPYAHAGLAAGECQTGAPGEAKGAETITRVTFREIGVKMQKPLRV